MAGDGRRLTQISVYAEGQRRGQQHEIHGIPRGDDWQVAEKRQQFSTAVPE